MPWKAARLQWERQIKPTRELSFHPVAIEGMVEVTKPFKYCDIKGSHTPPNWTDYQAVVYARHLREKYIGSMDVRLFVLTAMDESQSRIQR